METKFIYSQTEICFDLVQYPHPDLSIRFKKTPLVKSSDTLENP